jgi:uncharacterized protein
MISTETKNIIINHLKDFNPIKVGIFGSYARGDHKKNSDIDILVKLGKSPSFLELIKLENGLSKILGIKVDLITSGALRNKIIRKNIKKELISIL